MKNIFAKLFAKVEPVDTANIEPDTEKLVKAQKAYLVLAEVKANKKATKADLIAAIDEAMGHLVGVLA